jgi:hypothetical protein
VWILSGGEKKRKFRHVGNGMRPIGLVDGAGGTAPSRSKEEAVDGSQRRC